MCTLLASVAAGQNMHRLVVQKVDSLTAIEDLQIKNSFKNKEECDAYVAKLPLLLQSKGFLSASVDSVAESNNQTIVYLFTGEKYENLVLTIRNKDELYLQQVDWWQKKSRDKLMDFNDYQNLTRQLLDYFESSGYPFARISLDSISINQGRLTAVLNIDRGFLYRIDSIRLSGSANISRNFIHHYLNIEKGSPYNKKKFEKISQRLLELPYLEQTQPWDVTMLNTGSLVNLYLQPKKSNQVNVLAGFLPSNQQTGGKLLLTVDANLQLQNAFGSSESLGLVWQQIQPKSPRLHMQYTQPYMFNSAFGFDFLFDLYKKDSNFLNLNGQLGLVYAMSANKTAKVILQSQRTNLLELDTLQVKLSKQLPDVADVSSLNLGFDYNVFNTDYKFNPRRGEEWNLSAFVGNKTVRKSNAVTQLKDPLFDYNKLYDTVKLKTYQLRLKMKAAKYFKAGKQMVLKTGLDAGWYQSPRYFRNELFQIGGYRLLRGFDEESIFTNKYVVGTLEYRYLLGLNSNFFAFTDLGYAHNNILRQSNTYIGAGVGLSFQTQGGLFNISYAAGKRNDLNFDIKQSKIHLGFVSIF
jgi:outer membrane protein assembly factor BamA